MGYEERGRISSVRAGPPDGDYQVWVRYGLSAVGQLTPNEDLYWD